MKRRMHFSIIGIIFCILFSFFVNHSYVHLENTDNKINYNTTVLPDEKPATNSETTTILDFASSLIDKKEHYPLSDEFIERYQQTSGGYIDFAKKLGLTVDKNLHEPNQKWHFFESWLFESIKDGTLTWDADAKSRIYVGLKCPELLLWIFEASGASPSKVKSAKLVAEQGKIHKENVATTAKKMRDCVSWEDLKIDKNKVMATSVSLPESLEIHVGDSSLLEASVEPINTTDQAKWEVIEGKDLLTISPNGNTLSLKANRVGTAKVQVTYHPYVKATCTIHILESNNPRIIGLPRVVDLDINQSFSLSPVFTLKDATFSYQSSSNEITVDEYGLILAQSYGSADITVTCNEYEDISQVVHVEVFDHGSKENPLSIQRANELLENIRQENNDQTTSEFYVKGLVKNRVIDGSFILKDSNNELFIEDAIYLTGVDIVSQHDEVILKGYAKYQNNQIQLAKVNDSPVQVLQNIRGNSLITMKQCEHARMLINQEEVMGDITKKNGEQFLFQVEVDEGYILNQVLVNQKECLKEDDSYSFKVDGDTEIEIITKDASIMNESSYTYEVHYDLGTRKTAKEIVDVNEAYQSLIYQNEGEGIISSIKELERIYGGGNGGRNETAWYRGDMLKFGTTSVNGSMTISLKQKVNRVRITGFVSDQTSKIRVGDESSLDWINGTNNDTILYTCSDMNLATKEVVEGSLFETIEVEFSPTMELKIATTNKKPLYITMIEFIVSEE